MEKLEHSMPREGEDGTMACCHPMSTAIKILGAVSVYQAMSMYFASMCS